MAVLCSHDMRLSTQLKQYSSVATSSAAEAPRCVNQSEQMMSTSSVSDDGSLVEQDFAMDFSGTLFSTFNQMFPDPKEICN